TRAVTTPNVPRGLRGWRRSCLLTPIHPARSRTTRKESNMATAVSPIPKGYSTVTPVLTMQDTRKAIAWYEKALGAKEQSVSEGPDGKVMHASIRLGTSYLMLHDEMAGSKAP